MFSLLVSIFFSLQRNSPHKFNFIMLIKKREFQKFATGFFNVKVDARKKLNEFLDTNVF